MVNTFLGTIIKHRTFIVSGWKQIVIVIVIVIVIIIVVSCLIFFETIDTSDDTWKSAHIIHKVGNLQRGEIDEIKRYFYVPTYDVIKQ